MARELGVVKGPGERKGEGFLVVVDMVSFFLCVGGVCVCVVNVNRSATGCGFRFSGSFGPWTATRRGCEVEVG